MPERTLGRLPLCINAEPHRAALHEDDRMVPVFAADGCRQAEDAFRLAAPGHRLKTDRRQMVAFVDDQMAILANDVIDLALARQTLNDRYIDNAGGLAFATADLADGFWRKIEKGREAGDPLVEELPAVDQNQRVGLAGGDGISGHHGFAERRGRRQHPGVVAQ